MIGIWDIKGLIVYGLQVAGCKNQAFDLRLFILLCNIIIKNYELFYREQFKNCQATECKRADEDGNVITIFYSYSCPKLVKVKGDWYRFTFEGSRKAGCTTGSRTTSKQLTRFFGPEWRDLPVMNLQDFENEYFHTGVDGLY